MPRIARIIAPGYPHHITQRGNNRATVFFDDEDRQTYLKLLTGYNQKHHVQGAIGDAVIYLSIDTFSAYGTCHPCHA